MPVLNGSGFSYNTGGSIPTRICLWTVVDIGLTVGTFKPSGTLALVCINKVLWQNNTITIMGR